MLLPDERPLPPSLEERLASAPLVAPSHWPVETGNMLLVARRRGRIDDPAWAPAFDRLRALRVRVAAPPTWAALQDLARLAERNGLALYDAAYLQLAIGSSAALATLDGRLADAATRNGVQTLRP